MKLLVTGATGFLGWRTTILLRARGHDVVALARPGGAHRAAPDALDAVRLDAGDPRARELIAGCTAVLHFAGVPDPARARADPARAVRENAGTTLNLLEGCREHGAGLVYPSTVRAARDDARDPYAASKHLGEEVCRTHPAPATVVRLTSVFGPGQVAREGATGAIAAFAERALAGRPIVIPGDPRRTRDFLFVDDLVAALEGLAGHGPWNEIVVAASGIDTPLLEAAELVRAAAGSSVEIELPGGALPPGEDDSYPARDAGPRLGFAVRPLEETIPRYVNWLREHPAAQGRARA